MYRYVLSAVTKRALGGRWETSSMRLRKCLKQLKQLGGEGSLAKSSLAALSIICLECMLSMRVHVLLTIAFAGL